MGNLFSKHIQMLALVAFLMIGFLSTSDLMAQNSQQNQNQQVFPSLIGTEFRCENGFVYLGDKIYLCQNNVLTKANEVVNIGKTIVIKSDGTYTKNGVSQTILRGTKFTANGEIIK